MMKHAAMNRLGCGLLVALLLGLVSTTSVVAADALSFRASQSVVHFPNATVYFSVQDENGNFIDDLKAEQLTATLAGQSVPVKELKPFSVFSDGVAYIFLVDVSKSIRPAAFQDMKAALLTWVGSMGEKDRAAIVTFGTEVRVMQDFSADLPLLKEKIANLAVTDDFTQLHRGIVQALDIGRRKEVTLPTRRAIVVLSDGEDDYRGSMTRQEVLDRLRLDKVPIYAIGYLQGSPSMIKDRNLKSLGEFARISGGEYFEATEKPLETIYKDVQKRVGEAWQATFDVSARADGNISRLQLSLNRNGRTLTDSMPVLVLKPTPPAPVPQLDWKAKILQMPLWAISLGIGCLFLIIAGGIAIWRKKRNDSTLPAHKIQNDLSNSDTEPVPPTLGGMRFDVFGEAERDLSINLDKVAESAVGKPVDKGIIIRLTPLGKQENNGAVQVTMVGKMSIGRVRESNEVAFSGDPEISGRHCELFWENGVMLRDLGSKNGTFINGVRIGLRHRLRSGDILLIGRTELRVTIG